MATAIPTWAETYNQWFENELLPSSQPYTSTKLDIANFQKDASGAYVPTADAPVWSWTTGPDYWARKQDLDQRYLTALDEYNKANNTNIQPNASVLGAVQPNTTYRAADEGAWYSGVTDVLGGAVDLINSGIESVGDFVTNHPVEAALLVAGGYYFAPEIGAWISPAGEAVAGTEAGVAANAGIVSSPVTSGVANGVPLGELGSLGGAEAALSPVVAADVGSYGAVAPVTAEGAAAGGLGAAAAAAGGLTVANVIKALPLVPVVNQLAGDPLGLNQTQAPTTTGQTGFNIVPIPSEWKSPSAPVGTYSPIDLNSIFSNQNLLAGTQWQGLPNQRNVTFNDIFASGQQSTPMGTPVNINNIVSAILGQAATSQKST